MLQVSVPATIAGLAVWLEPVLTRWARTREAMLPLIVCLLLACMVHPRLRNLLVTALCFGVTFLALRDIYDPRQLTLPPSLDYQTLAELRPLVLGIVAVLSAIAGFGEALVPGTVWARRCYFGSAALYFSGLGFMNFYWHGNWKSVLLCVTGLTALFGCIFADRIVESEQEADADKEISDEVAQKERELAHLRALRAKEWHEDDREVPASLSSSAPTTSPQ